MNKKILAFFRQTVPEPEGQTRAILRNERNADGMRYLAVFYSPQGDLVITGQDIGNPVDDWFGCREYEWEWTIARANLPQLTKALNSEGNLLGALETRFHGPAAASLEKFLQENKISYKVWSRVGD